LNVPLPLRQVVIAIVALDLAACASPDTPVTQTIHVETPGCARASCVLSNDRGSWRLAQSPGDVTVVVSGQPLKALCVAEGGVESSGGAPAALAPPGHKGAATGMALGTAAGFALGGAALAIFPPLGIMALSTGALVGTVGGTVADSSQRQFSYPAQVSIAMSCGGEQDAAVAPSPRAPTVGVAFRGLSVAEASAAGIGERSAVRVTKVGSGGAAAAAGLRSGAIIQAGDGRAINDAADLEQVVLALAPGGSLALQVWREGRTVELRLTLPQATP
jgi:hypothetical protein